MVRSIEPGDRDSSFESHHIAMGLTFLRCFTGTNYIGGTGESQHEAAWRIPLALQLVPAVVLGIGIMFMPFSPR